MKNRILNKVLIREGIAMLRECEEQLYKIRKERKSGGFYADLSINAYLDSITTQEKIMEELKVELNDLLTCK